MVHTTNNHSCNEPPLGLMLEAGIGIAVFGAIAMALYAISAIDIGHGGLFLGSAIYLIIGIMVLKGLRQHCPHTHFGLANTITLMRAAFSSFLFALSADSLGGHLPWPDLFTQWLITALAAAFLALDGLDGLIARHTRMESRFGAQFDMHVDALFVLSLCLLLVISKLAAPWVLFNGLIFYVFHAAKHIWPAFEGELPPRWRRKAICVIQTILLITALAPVTPFWAAQLACLTGLALLIWSFGIDTVWLLRQENQ